MTGMDEIIVKTPDALVSGKSTESIIESCCPNVKNGWEVTSLDTDLLLVAIRIATFGNILEITNVCDKCGTEHDYDVDLTTVVNHFAQCKYDSVIEYNGLIIKLQPLTYKQTTDFSIRNMRLQQHLSAAAAQSADEQKKIIEELFKDLGALQNDIYSASVESVDTGTVVVTEPNFIYDWLTNCDKDVFDKIREQFNKNKDVWRVPDVKVKCSSCGHAAELSIDLDQSNFFAAA
jgi:hypothetical protein